MMRLGKIRLVAQAAAFTLILAACATQDFGAPPDAEVSDAGDRMSGEEPPLDPSFVPTDFSEVVGLVVDAAGILLADRREGQLYRVPVNGGNRRALGRQGNGPLEHRGVDGLISLSEGRVGLVDRRGRKLLVFADDRPVTSSRLPSGFEFPPWAGLDGKLLAFKDVLRNPMADSAALHALPLLSDDGGGTFIARVALARNLEIPVSAPQGSTTMAFIPQPFAPADGWSTGPDGLLSIVRAQPYRLEVFRQESRVHVGPELPARTRQLVAADLERWLQTPQPHPEWDWPEATPPFDPDRVLRTAGGETWVGTHLLERGLREWHRIDSTGALISTIMLPDGEEVWWVDAQGILVTRPDELGLRWLVRRAPPRPSH